MSSDADREFARRHAKRREEFHDERGSVRGLVTDTFDGTEAHYRGLLGECAFVKMFGGVVDVSLRAGGDGGRDFILPLVMDCGTVRRFVVDVKVTSFNGEPKRLFHQADRIKPKTIYVGAFYSILEDDVTLRCWAWGSELVRANDVRVFNGRGIENYTQPHEACRRLDELTSRVPSAQLAITLNLVDKFVMGLWP